MDDINSPFTSDMHQAQIPFLDAIDKLREHCPGVYEDIQFPQWIVVGDQDTGKSSVMEAIS
jgi:polynucleotide 5'-kinase involved in rRNA processing